MESSARHLSAPHGNGGLRRDPRGRAVGLLGPAPAPGSPLSGAATKPQLEDEGTCYVQSLEFRFMI